MTTTNLIARDRAPDYHIGANGIPRLTQVTTAAGSRMRKMNSRHQFQLQQQLQPTDPVKLNKCLYNLTVRNGSGTVQSDKPANSSKIESDIAIRNTQYSSSGGVGGSKSSSSLSPASLNSGLRRSSPSTTVTSSPLQTSGDPRRSTNTSHQFNSSSSIPRSNNNNNSSSYSSNSRNNTGGGGRGSPRTLLGGRQRYQQHRSAVTTGDDEGTAAGDGVDANLINAGGDRRSSSAVVRQYNRLSAAIDNRLSYQRKYDRTIFGCNRLNQFVLPPLQI